MAKYFITPGELQRDSFTLAGKVLDDDFVPTHIVALWRGGAPIGCHVHEAFKAAGHTVDHIAIRTSLYTGPDSESTASTVQVHNLGYLVERLQQDSRVLLVDDVWESGRSIDAIHAKLQKKLGAKMPRDMRTAAMYFKSARNKSTRTPNYFLYDRDQWIVFPHELEGLTYDELVEHRGQAVADMVMRAKGK